MEEVIEQFLKERCLEEVARALKEGKESVVIDFQEIDRFNPELGDSLLERPQEIIELFKQKLAQLELPMMKELEPRFTNLPESARLAIREIRSEHIGKLVCAEGLVRQASDVRPLTKIAIFECQLCKQRIEVEQEGRKIKQPALCSNCAGKRFKLIGKIFEDVQRIVIEESPEELEGGEQPRRMSIFLSKDLVDPQLVRKTCPGSRVRVIGIVEEVPVVLQVGAVSTTSDLMIRANNIETLEYEFREIELSEEDEKRIKEFAQDPELYAKLTRSIAPTIYGHEVIKEALLLQLFGGVKKVLPDGSKRRGDIHVLLVGDPGTAKTMLLKYISSLAPKARYVTGKGMTTAGLCVGYDTLVQLDDGSLIPIGELVESELRKGAEEMIPGVWVAREPTSRKILAIDLKNFKLVSLRITQYWKLKAPDSLIELETETGKRLTITPNTPLLVIRDGAFRWLEARELEKGDLIATARRLEGGSRIPNALELIGDEAYLINSKSIVDELVPKVKEFGIRRYCECTGIDEGRLYYGWRKKGEKPTLRALRRICRDFNLDMLKMLPEELILSTCRGKVIKLPRELDSRLSYLAGLIAGDGYMQIGGGWGGYTIGFFNTCSHLIDGVADICRELMVKVEKGERYGVPYLRFHSKPLWKLLEGFGIPLGKKGKKLDISPLISSLPNELLSSYLRGLFDAYGSVIKRSDGRVYIELTSSSEQFIRKLQLLLLRFGIKGWIRKRKGKKSAIRGRSINSGERWALEVRDIANVRRFAENIGFAHPTQWKKLSEILSKRTRDKELIPVGGMLRKARIKIGLPANKLYGYNGWCRLEKGKLSREFLLKVLEKLREYGECDELRQLIACATGDLGFERIKKLERVNGCEYVYDLTVEGEHSFLGNGILVHNTAVVTRDEFLRGWSLEAGALVLANKGICVIDDIDKMRPEDRVAMHEAMEVQTVSISKANIQATLKAETTILAAANPRLGRFDPYVPLADQINLPPTLINRFDLIFTMRDIPESEHDKRIADHILRSIQSPATVEPEVGVEFMRKYIAYAKQIDPKLSEEALEEIRNFYLTLRSRAGGEGGEIRPIPISARQLEALVRLAEASARARLSDVVNKEDAQRAIRLLKHCLRQVGMDYETGEIDIDKIVVGVTAAQRSKIMEVRAIVKELEERFGKNIPVSEVIEEAKKKGLDEMRVKEIIERMKREGELYEPKPGMLRRTEA